MPPKLIAWNLLRWWTLMKSTTFHWWYGFQAVFSPFFSCSLPGFLRASTDSPFRNFPWRRHYECSSRLGILVTVPYSNSSNTQCFIAQIRHTLSSTNDFPFVTPLWSPTLSHASVPQLSRLHQICLNFCPNHAVKYSLPHPHELLALAANSIPRFFLARHLVWSMVDKIGSRTTLTWKQTRFSNAFFLLLNLSSTLLNFICRHLLTCRTSTTLFCFSYFLALVGTLAHIRDHAQSLARGAFHNNSVWLHYPVPCALILARGSKSTICCRSVPLEAWRRT